jgi:hypothetical protein
MVFSCGARSPRQALSRPSGVVNFAEGNTHASGLEDQLCCRHSVMRFCVVNDKATVRFERSLLGRSNLPPKQSNELSSRSAVLPYI